MSSPVLEQHRPGIVIYSLSAGACALSVEELRTCCPLPPAGVVAIVVPAGLAWSDALLSFLRELLALAPERLAVCGPLDDRARQERGLMDAHFPTLEDCLTEVGLVCSTPLGGTVLSAALNWLVGGQSAAMPQKDRLHFTVLTPVGMAAGRSYLLDVWAHLPEQHSAVLERAAELFHRPPPSRIKGPVAVARGTELAVRLLLPGFSIEEPLDILVWDGEPTSASFVVAVPADLAVGQHVGRVDVLLGGQRVLRILFPVVVEQHRPEPVAVGRQVPLIQRAFASYASEDRSEVGKRIQGLEKLGMKVFMDVVSLRSGDAWQERLFQEIVASDMLYLFWSRAARQSKWVDWEWRLALRTKGTDGIDPIPLESPELAPPPPELADKHFNDWVLPLLAAR